MAECFECKKQFPEEIIYGGQMKEGMPISVRARDVCKSCRKKFGYFTIGSRPYIPCSGCKVVHLKKCEKHDPTAD